MEKISALMDGELDGHDAHQQIQRLKQDRELADGWHTFHLIGDVMRDEQPLSARFSSRLTDRISAEPTVIGPRRRTVSRATAFALSAAASLSAIALVGWMAFSTTTSLAPDPQVATAPTPAPLALPASAPPPAIASVPSDGTMNEYLMAHQEFSPSTAIQGLAPYIRSVSITREPQGR